MHRSGTSMLANWMFKSGLHLGENLIDANPSNPQGHFEDWDFVNIHNLAVNEYSSYLFTERPNPQILVQIREKLKILISSKEKKNQIWGFKDPRTCVFLDTYDALLERPLYIFIFRNYQDASNSYLRREYFYNQYCRFPRVQNQILNFRKKRYINSYIDSWNFHNSQIINHLIESKNFSILIEYEDFMLGYKNLYEILRNYWKNMEYVDYQNSMKIDRPPQKKIQMFRKDSENILIELRKLKTKII